MTAKGQVKGNSRTPGFSVTFTRGKRACTLAVLGMSRMSTSPLASLAIRDVRLLLPEGSNRTKPATALEVL